MQIMQWDQELTTEQTNAFVKELASRHLQEVQYGLPGRADIRKCVASDNFSALCDFVLDYQAIANFGANPGVEPGPFQGLRWTPSAYHMRQVLAFYQKRDDLDIGCDKKENALIKLRAAESRCCETNDIFKKHAAGKFFFRPRVESILHEAQRKIAKILGDVPKLADVQLRFGKGATTNVQKRNASAREKLRSRIQCSEDLEPVLLEALDQVVGWLDHIIPWNVNEPELQLEGTLDIDIVVGRLSFVLKNAKTFRTIVPQPSLNGIFQMGIGDYMFERLAKFGIDLRDQTRNQRLAQHGSLTGELATLDLSAASDTIATELVAHLLPVDWFLFLNYFRTSFVEVDGKVLRLGQFSSMGNGYTFPLETTIFHALAAACAEACGHTDFLVSTYGDDLIVPTDTYPLLSEVLDCCGFVVNDEKSFASGPFRESCGADYYFGMNIRPFYQRSRITGESMIALHNFYVRNDLPEFAQIVVDHLGPQLLLWGPDGYGDGHLIGDWDHRPHKRELGWCGSVFDTYSWKAKRKFAYLKPGDGALPCYSIYARPSGRAWQIEPPIETDWKVFPYDFTEFPMFWELPEITEATYLYDRKGRLGFTTPGRETYKRISIYTLAI